jgi:hypothetical protein
LELWIFLPEWIADDQEDDVCFIGTGEDVITAGFD